MSEELKNKILNNIEELSHIEHKDETRFRLDCLIISGLFFYRFT